MATAAKNPLDGVSLDQLDLSDPETRQYVSQYVDMSDPETAKAFQALDPETQGPVPVAEMGASSDQSKPKTRWESALEAAQGERPGLDPANEFGNSRFLDIGGVKIGNPLSTLRDAADVTARGLEYAGAAGLMGLEALDDIAIGTGLADLPGAIGLDKLMNNPGGRFLPGSMIGALGDAFPLGGAEVGLANPAAAAARKLTPEQEQAYIHVAERGTPEQILQFAKQEGFDLEPEAVSNFVKERDSGRPVGDTVEYKQQELPLEEQGSLPFEGPTPQERAMEVKLRQEADDFLANRPEDTTPDIRQRELPLDTPPQQRSFDFGETEPPKQKAINARDTGDEISPEVSGAVDHINKVTEGWENAPAIEVFDNFDNLTDIDPLAIGVLRPDGSVAVNMKNVIAEAEALGVAPNDVLSATTFHEALGHHGLSQKFGDGLDSFLEGMYNNSTKFKDDVDSWIAQNPDEYLDDVNPLARAAEEVLAEMSEKGAITPSTMDRLKNWLKGLGRQAGLKMEYSDREVKTILGMAHDAVIKGPTRDVVGNGFRYRPRTKNLSEMTDEELIQHRRQLSKAATAELDKVENGKTKTLQPFPEQEPDYWRFAHKTDDGKTVTGYYTVENGKLDNFSISSEGGPRAIGPRAIRQIGRDLLKEHPEAKGVSGYRLSGARQTEEFVTSGNKFMKRRTIGPGSKGQPKGSFNEPEAEASSIIANYRSKRPVEDILAEVAPEKSPESWDEWIDDAGKIKMTGKLAQSLAKGAAVPELKAAERFLLESTNRIFDLSRKAGQGRASERELYLLGKEIERAKNVAESIQDVVSNSARILNSRKIEVASDKALSDGIRNMLRTVEKGDLDSPEKITKIAEKLRKGDIKAKRVGKAMDILANALNLPRTIMSSFDLSAPLRQGIFFVGRKELWKGFPKMFKMFGDEEVYNAVMQDIKSRPNYQLMEDSGLSLADLGGRLVDREERFISTWAEKIPVAGRGIRASERAYTGFLNKLRADVFDDIVRQYKAAGIDLKGHSPQAKGIADFINNATGRGNLGKWSQAAPALSGIFFSPRLIASRVRMLNPNTYVKMDPIVRKNALKSLASFGGIAMSALALAKLAGAEVETDPRSSDFAKIKVDNTRYDILGGFGQYLTLGARLASNQKKNAKGEIVELGKKYGADTRLDVLLKFGINKESPVASFVTSYLEGKDPIGQPFDAKKEIAERFVPLFLQDAAEVIKEEGVKGVPMSLPGLFGIGTNTYGFDLGYDAFGRDIGKTLAEGKEEVDPVILEVQRLNTSSDTSVIAAAPSSVQDDNVRVKLTPEQKNEWQKVMGSYTHEYLQEDMASEEYKMASDAEKIEIIKQAHRDAYEDTKADLIDSIIPQEGVE